MQRHRNDGVRVGENVGAGPRHPGPERRGEFASIGILEPMHQAARRPVLEARHRARAPEDRRIGDRLRRQQPRPEILLERRAEPLAERPLDEAHRPPAGGAKRVGLAGRRAAGQARRGIERIERGAAEAAEQAAQPRAERRRRTELGVAGERRGHEGELSRNFDRGERNLCEKFGAPGTRGATGPGATLPRAPKTPTAVMAVGRSRHPLTQISGRRRATLRASPARSAAATTASTSL